MSDPVWLKREADATALLTLHVQPGASRSELAGEHGDALKVRLAAPPVDGRANAALIAYLSEILALPRAAIQLASGHSSRRKRVRIALPATLILERLQSEMATSSGVRPAP